MNYLVIIVLLVIGIIFLLTSFDKMINWKRHISTIENYRILPRKIVHPFFFIMLLTELYIVVSLFILGVTFWSFIAFTLLLTIYTSAILINMYRGNVHISCGCGSILESEQLSYRLVLRNALLMVTYGCLYLFNQFHVTLLPVLEVVNLVIVSVSLVLLGAILKEFFVGKRILRKVLQLFHLGVNN